MRLSKFHYTLVHSVYNCCRLKKSVEYLLENIAVNCSDWVIVNFKISADYYTDNFVLTTGVVLILFVSDTQVQSFDTDFVSFLSFFFAAAAAV